MGFWEEMSKPALIIETESYDDEDDRPSIKRIRAIEEKMLELKDENSRLKKMLVMRKLNAIDVKHKVLLE